MKLPQKTERAAVRYSALRWKEGVRTMGNNKYKILIVEDEANIRSFIKANLETSDYQVLCAETCALGIMMYASHRPDLIVLDLGLPDRDGLDLIQKVRESDTVPIIVLSARSNERDKVEAWIWGRMIISPSPLARRNCWPVSAPFSAVIGTVKRKKAPPAENSTFRIC
mgnify:FL=1